MKNTYILVSSVTGKIILRRRLEKLIQERSDYSGFVLVGVFSPLTGSFTDSLFFSASFILVFGLLEETAPELERWSVE